MKTNENQVALSKHPQRQVTLKQEVSKKRWEDRWTVQQQIQMKRNLKLQLQLRQLIYTHGALYFSNCAFLLEMTIFRSEIIIFFFSFFTFEKQTFKCPMFSSWYGFGQKRLWKLQFFVVGSSETYVLTNQRMKIPFTITAQCTGFKDSTRGYVVVEHGWEDSKNEWGTVVCISRSIQIFVNFWF